VNQMIMGAGKTTVVGPLLALLLADGKSLVMQVVPKALLDFSRAVLRERFSSLIRKPVYTFALDRLTPVTPELYAKFIKARELRAVVITDPKSIKSFALKLVELCHELGRVSAGFSSSHSSSELRAQAAECVKVISIWKSSVLLMDEVDLILHPLKSELNYPVGTKEPLDFTANRIGRGLRWELPFFILDALCYATHGSIKEEKHQQSRQMTSLLTRLKNTVSEGMSKNLVQTVPHFVLLRKSFYHAHLLPLLAQWSIIWILSKGLTGLTEDQILAYLLQGPKSEEASGPIRRARTMNSDYTKMLNLAHDWLTSLLPHILSKVDRVSFGLLTPEDLSKLLQHDPNMPRSRRFLAVPFVGKDVPSPASEFAHPDIVIGLTILAYRYEGLRQSDFRALMVNLRNVMLNESGPYNKRKSCLAFAQWVTLSGARIRGSRREEEKRREELAKRKKQNSVVAL